MKLALPAAALLILAEMPAAAHRLDEYLQGTIISVEKNRIHAEMTLIPGVTVFPALLNLIDTDHDGVISTAEQRVYVDQVLHDLSITIDGHPLTPHLLSAEFPAPEEMKEGRGEIQIDFDTGLPAGKPERQFTLTNHHQRQISAYQVNCLVPRDPAIRVVSQRRNYSQSVYELNFVQGQSGAVRFSWLPVDLRKPLGTLALVVFAWLGLLWRRRT